VYRIRQVLTSCTIRHISLVPWCIGFDRCHYIHYYFFSFSYSLFLCKTADRSLVNNSSNINKTKTTSLLKLLNKTKKKTTTYAVTGLGQAHKSGRVNQLRCGFVVLSSIDLYQKNWWFDKWNPCQHSMWPCHRLGLHVFHYFSSYLRKNYGLILNQDEKLVYFLYVVCRYFLVIYSWSTHPCLDILLLHSDRLSWLSVILTPWMHINDVMVIVLG
jgi:hypothetical protein